MPSKKPKFKGEPDTTYVVNHPEAGEITFSTNASGEYTPKDDVEQDAIARAHPVEPPPPGTGLPVEPVEEG